MSEQTRELKAADCHVPVPWYHLPVFHLWHKAIGIADAAVPVVDGSGDVKCRVRRVRQEVGPAHHSTQPQSRPRRVLFGDGDLGSFSKRTLIFLLQLIHITPKIFFAILPLASSLIEHVLHEASVEWGLEGDAAVAAADAVVEGQPHLRLTEGVDSLKSTRVKSIDSSHIFQLIYYQMTRENSSYTQMLQDSSQEIKLKLS